MKQGGLKELPLAQLREMMFNHRNAPSLSLSLAQYPPSLECLSIMHPVTSCLVEGNLILFFPEFIIEFKKPCLGSIM